MWQLWPLSFCFVGGCCCSAALGAGVEGVVGILGIQQRGLTRREVSPVEVIMQQNTYLVVRNDKVD
jgi:hypothetical protein